MLVSLTFLLLSYLGKLSSAALDGLSHASGRSTSAALTSPGLALLSPYQQDQLSCAAQVKYPACSHGLSELRGGCDGGRRAALPAMAIAGQTRSHVSPSPNLLTFRAKCRANISMLQLMRARFSSLTGSRQT